MPGITVDNRTIEVPAGTTVLEAAKHLGIWIPHFCYHPALGSVGACRVCAVKMLEGPVKGIQMSCMLPVQEGMVVSTTDPEALAMRRHVIEWLMLNHPHDCPVCDEGGECLLQDYTVAGGHGIRRYQGKKRTHQNQYLGPCIEHEMNRCIQCYRCVRFYQEYAGGTDFGVMGSAAKVYFGRFQEGKLESPFSGNLVDICPTGVFTDKTARFRARYWDYEMAPSICPHCSLGCNTTPAARFRELLKMMARPNETVNGWFICDQGRFSNEAVNDPLRPRTPAVEGQPSQFDQTIDAIAEKIQEIKRLHGPASIVLAGSARLSHEAATLLASLAAAIGTAHLSYFVDQNEQDFTTAAVNYLTQNKAASQADVRQADLVTICGDPLSASPMLALAIRQAFRRNARIYCVGAKADHEWASTLNIPVTLVSSVTEIPFKEAKKPVMVCDLKNFPSAAEANIKTSCILKGPNSFGAALLCLEFGAAPLREIIANDSIKGIMAFEADLPDEILERLPFLIAADWQATATVQKSGMFLPTASWVEMDGSYCNNTGERQYFNRVMAPGLPVKTHEPALHPSRVPAHSPPGSEPQPAARIIEELIKRITST